MDKNEKIDLTKYLEIYYRALKKLKFIMIIIIIACTALSIVRTLFTFHNEYSSYAVFVVYTKDQDNIFTTSDESDDMFSTFSSLMTGDMMQQMIVKDLNLKSLNATISLSKITDTNLVQLKVTSSDADNAYNISKCILNNHAQVTHMVMSDVYIAVIDTPLKATSPDSTPGIIKSGIEGLAVGIVISLVIAFVYSIFRHTIIDSKDVKNVLHLNNIAKIPFVGGSKKKKSHLLLSNPRIQYSFRQAFHDLRLRVEQDHKKHDSKVFLVSSVLPNEGKTTVSVNLAITLAQKGNSVVLVDLDLRNPSIYGMLDNPKLSGNIVDYLKGHYSLAEVINRYRDYSLDIIYGVKSINDASEMLSKESLEKLIETLKEHYDYVILDVTPLYILEDALIVADHCDDAIIVIKQDYASRSELMDALEELNEHAPRILGTVINQVKPSLFDKEDHYYGYGYGYR